MFFKKKNLEIISNTYKLIQGKYKKKQNIQLFLKNKTFSNSEIIKLAYDIQSGSYIKFFKKLNKKKDGRKATIGYFRSNIKQIGKQKVPIFIEIKDIFSK